MSNLLNFKVFSLTTIVAALLSIVGCSNNEDQSTKIDANSSAEIWAKVNSTNLTEPELEYAVKKLLGDQFVDARVLHNIRESLISSRAISLKAASVLDKNIQDEIEIATNAFREEKLIAAYIQQTVTPNPVSSKQVNEYYQSHLSDFGAQTVKSLQILKLDLSKSEISASKAVTILSKVSSSKNWKVATKSTPENVELITATSNKQLSPRLKSTITSLVINDVSGVIVEKDNAYVLKITGQQDIPPKPINEVSAIIRKRLAVQQLKTVVKQISEQILAESEVARLSN